MSFFLPLLLAGALAAPAASSNAALDDKNPRKRHAVVDTVEHRRIAADLVKRATIAAEGGSLAEARAQLLAANTMHRESGGVDESTIYKLVHVNYALDRYIEAANLLDELADEAVKRGDVKLAAFASVDAAVLYSMSERRSDAAACVTLVRSLMNDKRISDADRETLKKRLG